MLLSTPIEGWMAENAFGVISAGFMKTIHVELSNEAIHFVVSEVSRKDNLLKFIDILDDEFKSGWGPVGNFRELLILNVMKNTLRISKVLAMKPAISLV